MKFNLLLIFVFFAAIGVAQPDNDDCSSAMIVSTGSDQSFSSLLATTDGPEHPTASCFSFGGDNVHNDIWYSFTANNNGFIEWSTCNSVNFDTRLAVYSSSAICPVQDADLMACNDDGVGCDNFTSSVIFEVVSGQSYLLRLGGYVEGDFGEGSFDLIEISEPDVSPHSDCSDADFVPVVNQDQADMGIGWIFGNNLYAPAENEVEAPTCLPLGEFYDVWYSFNNGINDTITCNFESFTDTADYVVEVYANCDSVAASTFDGGEIFVGCFILPDGFVGEFDITGFENPADYIIRIATQITNNFPGEFAFQLIGQDEAVSLNDASTDYLKIFPNPASDRLFLENVPPNAEVQLFSINGSLLRSWRLSGNASVDLSSFPSGMYQLRVQSFERVATKKLIIH